MTWACEPASQPGEHRAGWEAAGREGELLGQGRGVRKGERQMGIKRECQGEGCSWQEVGGYGSTPPFPGRCLSLPDFIWQKYWSKNEVDLKEVVRVGLLGWARGRRVANVLTQ